MKEEGWFDGVNLFVVAHHTQRSFWARIVLSKALCFIVMLLHNVVLMQKLFPYVRKCEAVG
jgi:hypothetical protein